MKPKNMPKRGASPDILGFGPDVTFDKDRYAKNYGYSNFAELKIAGNDDHVKMIQSAEDAFNKSKNEIIPWMESHVATADTVHELVEAVTALEVEVAALTKRLAALEKNK